MSLRVTALIYMACFAAASMGIYLIKYSVQNMQREVVAMQDSVAHEKESLHLLKAEWANLKPPERLHRLADAHLNLVPLDSKKIEEISVLPAAATIDSAAPATNSMYMPVSQVEEK